jgi:ribosomal protein S18 acetylase RimI-like enzyme
MSTNNFERLLQLAEEVFAVKNDPSQLDVDEEVIDRLKRMHPSTVSEHNDGNGPVAWLLLIPTTNGLMVRFLQHNISENELFDLTPTDTTYDALYLCSALVLEEFRRKGIVKRLAFSAIESIRKDHPIKSLFVWPFSGEGDIASESIAGMVSLPLFKR